MQSNTKIKLFVLDHIDISVYLFLIRMRDIGILVSMWILYNSIFKGFYVWYTFMLIFNCIIIYYLNHIKKDLLLGKTCGSKILLTMNPLKK